MVGCASLANLTATYSPIFKAILAIISLILFIMITIKFIAYPNLLKEDLKNPVLSALSPTYPMGLMILSVDAKPFLGNFSMVLWFIAIAIYLYTFLHFVHKFAKSFRINNVYLPYLIPFIGFSVITMTSGAFGMHTIGLIAFYIAAISSAILIWPVFYRYITYTDIPDSVKPSLTILSAPIAIILVAYFSIFEEKSTLLISLLLGISVISCIIVLRFLPSLVKLEF
ncbi:MAG: hypothetical protein JJE03_06105 [Peptostreptococcaceae bacterium]|nr:hypothetical protein [Peptostreptococcaceae bacterium]